MRRHEFLSRLHSRLQPRTYVEIGIDKGLSMTLSHVPSIGIDPDYRIVAEIQTDVQLARTTSDEFFAAADPLAHLPFPVIYLAFIDGMHLAEYALRDFLSIERFTHPTSVVVFDDVLPPTVLAANRYRRSGIWAGDVYKAVSALREERPDLVVLEVDTVRTGVAVVLCPDASRDGVHPGYDTWVERVVLPDPQDVPGEVLGRTRAVAPEWLLASPVWDTLRSRRTSRAGTASAAVRASLDALAASAG